MRRIVLVRHGETVGESKIRFHGSMDIELSGEGKAQMRAARARLGGEHFDLVVASPLKRAWRSAWIVGGGAPVQLEAGFREIHFGRWESLTRDEIKATDPILFEDWEKRASGFEYPNGEKRAVFEARVEAVLQNLLARSENSALVIVHKGVIRAIVARLTGSTLETDKPELGGIVEITRGVDGKWFLGKNSSNPKALEEAAA